MIKESVLSKHDITVLYKAVQLFLSELFDWFLLSNLLNCMPCVPSCQRGLHANVLACQHGLDVNRPNANFSFLCANVPVNVLMCPTACQCFNLQANEPNGLPIFQNLRNAKGNFYTLLFYKTFYLILNIIVGLSCICVSIVIKNCIILHFKEKYVEFFFFLSFFFFFFFLAF